jgi:hypothetical protein
MLRLVGKTFVQRGRQIGRAPQPAKNTVRRITTEELEEEASERVARTAAQRATHKTPDHGVVLFRYKSWETYQRLCWGATVLLPVVSYASYELATSDNAVLPRYAFPRFGHIRCPGRSVQ